MGDFKGFPAETFRFLGELRENNEKAWFEENKDRYETLCKGPALDFIAAVSDGMSRLKPALKAEPKLNGSLRRLHRDIRFSEDKSPFHSHLHLVFWAGDHPNRSAGFHFLLNPAGIGYGAGQWGLEKAKLDRYRDRVCTEKDRAALTEALAKAQKVGCYLDEPALKRVPKGYDHDPEWDYLLRYKGIVVRTMDGAIMPDWIEKPEAADAVLERAERLSSLIAWVHAL